MHVPVSGLDLKLGFRMLVKYPGLTIVGGLAMAFAIWVGAIAFELVTRVVYPRLPLPDGDRIVGIRLWHTLSSSVEEQVLHDFVTWREELKSVGDLGAFRSVERNLIRTDGLAFPVAVAEITASAFRVARVPPLLGRTIADADEQRGAPGVVVIGHDLWRTHFGSDRSIVGREVRIGGTVHTVVGVMPEGFAFPVAQNVWVPLQLNVAEYGRREGPSLTVFGRLKPGVTLAAAQAELNVIGQRASAAFPDTHEHMRPQVMPYAKSILDLPQAVSLLLSGSASLTVVLLLALVCGNVALLLFARAATRENEIVIRNALGATRGRIIGQLFAEALVLATVAAVIGLTAAGAGVEWAWGAIRAEFGDGLPFWLTGGRSLALILCTAVLTLLAAAIAGVVPALKVTRGLATRLRQTTPGGGGFRFGGVWTAVIVAQVAVTVAFPAVTYFAQRDVTQVSRVDVGVAETEYLTVRLAMEREDPLGAAAGRSTADFRAQYRAAVQELERRVSEEPAVAGVSVADRLPRMYHPHRRIEVDEGRAAPPDPRYRGPGYRISSASVAPNYFDVLQAPILAGRGFDAADAASDAQAIIVNESFVNNVLGGANPIGRRVRYLYFEEWGDRPRTNQQPEPWYEIVGVVRDLGMAPLDEAKVAGFYHPLGSEATPRGADPVHMAMHLRGDAGSFTPRLRALAAAVDPALRLNDILRLDQLDDARLEFYAFWVWLSILVCAVALLLALAGIYAVISFTVSQRRREIGIRVSLGADKRSILVAIFRRPLMQVGIGVLAGAVITGTLVQLATWDGLTVRTVSLVAAYGVLMLGVCLLACIVPTRRVLAIEPAEVLKQE